MKPSVLLITDVDFWRNGAGSLSRVSTLVRFLHTHVNLSVIYLGVELQNDREKISLGYTTMNFTFLDSLQPHTMTEYGILLKRFLKHHSFDYCILEYVHLSTLTRHLPWKTKVFLDIHDIVSERAESFRKFSVHIASFDIPAKLEYKLFKLYDKVLVLTRQDFITVAKKIGEKRVLLVPHATTAERKQVRADVKSIAFIASDYYPNVDGLKFFYEDIWPSIHSRFPEVELHVYGLIARAFDPSEYSGAQFKGFIYNIDEIYDRVDIVINPVRFGAGLKIKNVEALAQGVPLVTMRHGAIGISDSETVPFLVADSAEDFISHLADLITLPEKRLTLSCQSFQFARDNYVPEVCFRPLLQAFEK